jgi:hypothetical protein
VRIPFIAALMAGALATSVQARTVVVQVASASCNAATLRATSAAGASVERPWTGAGVSFDLDEGAWTITATAPGCWAAPVDAAASPVKITLWPAATLRFRVEDPRDASVQVRVASADGKIAPVVIDCARDGGLYTCSVPATSLDLRIGADGFVPTYLWGRDAAAQARVDLGAIRLARGASVSGRVTLPLKDPKLDDISVQLAPAEVVDSRRAALLTQTVKANRRGFFQFGGVSEGTYSVVARAKGWSPASSGDVRVVAGAEVALPKPLELTPLATLEVFIDPPADAGGKPWRIRMARTWPPLTDPTDVIRASASPSGEWSRQHLAAGRYDLSVEDAAGSTLHRQFVDVADGAPPVRISISSFRVRGHVTFRGEPLECGVWLTHPMNASASIRVRSDKDGKFEAVLPKEGTWKVQLVVGNNYAQLRPIEIRRRSDGDPVDLALALPAGRIRGKTVDESGNPVASYVAVSANGRNAASVMASDGTFDLIGIEPADVMIHASNDALDRDGGLVPVHVTETADDPITVPVPKRRKAKAWLVTPEGQPIAGALVRYASAGSVKEEVTGPEGELLLALPNGELSVPLVVLSSGFPRKMMMLGVGAEPREIVVSRVAARLLLQHTPRSYWIAHDGAIFLGNFLFAPAYGGRPREVTEAGFALDVEPGSYAICATASSERCKTFVLQAGTTTTVDVAEIFSR